MKAKITYRVGSLPHPFDSERRAQGIQAWCLIKVVVPSLGPKSEEPVAIFNFDGEARTFMAHVSAEGLDGLLVEIDDEYRKLLLKLPWT